MIVYVDRIPKIKKRNQLDTKLNCDGTQILFGLPTD